MQQIRMRRKEYLQILVDWQLDNRGTEELSKTWYLPINLLYVISYNPECLIVSKSYYFSTLRKSVITQ